LIHTPSSHCSVDVHVFWGATDPVSVTHPPPAATPVMQFDWSLVRETHAPASHCNVSVHVFGA
jgi:hypothetical protein